MAMPGPLTRSRREFLSQAALAAAMAGVGPGVASLLSGPQASARPYLDVARRCAQWIDRSAQPGEGGVAWPADPLKPASIGLDFYNGTPGVVYFVANLWHATGDPRWRDLAQRGGTYLVAASRRRGPTLDAGLYTGLAGLAATYLALDALKVGPGWAEAARQAVGELVARAKPVGDGVEWSDANDIISGTAGTGLLLLDAAARLDDATARDMAVKAGRRLLRTAQPAEGGLMWFPSASLQRNYPNFSHGTAGVAYFLATLRWQTGERAFLDPALAGARYLEAVATRRDGARAIFHQSGGGENRFYLSWCHGPVGSARLFQRLRQTTGDTQWDVWLAELTRWILQSGAPERRSDGYWNNVSQCCGHAGIGQYWIDLARFPKTVGGLDLAALSDRVVRDTRARATDDESGLRWVQAENRTQPENLMAQTGFMQGAAGVGTFFLQLDALSRGAIWPTPWPDTPWRPRA
jgi:lantibiotic modifying enzyme